MTEYKGWNPVFTFSICFSNPTDFMIIKTMMEENIFTLISLNSASQWHNSNGQTDTTFICIICTKTGRCKSARRFLDNASKQFYFWKPDEFYFYQYWISILISISILCSRFQASNLLKSCSSLFNIFNYFAWQHQTIRHPLRLGFDRAGMRVKKK